MKSFGNSKYFVTFIDNHSRYTQVYFLKSKHEVLKKFKEFANYVSTLGKKIKVICSDNGGEYCSKEFNDNVKENGILHQQTVPYNPEQNGTAEIRSCKHMLLENIPIEMRLCNEPVNINDENAVVVQAKVHGKFQSIGYIPGKKIKKILSAINDNAITDIVLTRVQYSYIWGAGEHKYIPQITVTKHGKLSRDDKTYRYNGLFD
jgi:hypothetical protein